MKRPSWLAQPIADLPGVVAYRCECLHPTNGTLSMFYADTEALAMDYHNLGWTVTPLGRVAGHPMMAHRKDK